MSYEALIKRAKKAIDDAANRESPACVHKVTIDTDIAKLSGLVVVLHPDYTSPQKQAIDQ